MQENDQYARFASSILTALQLKLKNFQEKVEQKEPYETQINQWIREQYEAKKSTNEAIKNIYASLRQMLKSADSY